MAKSVDVHTQASQESRPTKSRSACTARIFGPVPSRRLGRSLGVDLVPAKTCSYNCIYCESGSTTHLTVERFSPYSVQEIFEELEQHLALTSSPPEVITLSGAGEPTLYAGLGDLINRIKNLTPLPIAVLTNGSLLGFREVRHDLARADVVMPSLDAASVEVFKRINQPHPSLQLEQIISGLQDFRREFSGEIWLEILFVSGVNDLPTEVQALRRVVDRLQPERIQLNTVDRPPPVPWANPISRESLNKLACLLGEPAEVISRFDSPASGEPAADDLAQRIIEMVSRRPCTSQQIAKSLGVEFVQVSDLLSSMAEDGQIDYKRYRDNYYYTSRIV